MKLLITADDAGYCKERDRGIFRLINEGVLKNTSLLVNFEGVGDTVESLKHFQSKYELCVGLHINFTEGKPISSNVTTLVDDFGNMKGKMGFRESWLNGIIEPSDIVNELESQLELFKTLMGYYPSHIDSHQHTHQIKSIATLIIPILQKYGIKSVRLPCSIHQSYPPRGVSPFLKSVYEQALEVYNIYVGAGFMVPSGFIGLNLMGNGSTEKVVQELNFILEKIKPEELSEFYVEWMVHPGFVNLTTDDFSASKERELEMVLLLSIKSILEKNFKDVTLLSWDKIVSRFT